MANGVDQNLALQIWNSLFESILNDSICDESQTRSNKSSSAKRTFELKRVIRLRKHHTNSTKSNPNINHRSSCCWNTTGIGGSDPGLGDPRRWPLGSRRRTQRSRRGGGGRRCYGPRRTPWGEVRGGNCREITGGISGRIKGPAGPPSIAILSILSPSLRFQALHSSAPCRVPGRTLPVPFPSRDSTTANLRQTL